MGQLFQRVSTEQEQSPADLISLVNSTEELLWSVDRSYNLLAFNRAFYKTLQSSYGIRAASGMGLAELFPQAMAAIWRAHFEKVLFEGPFHHNHLMPNGRILELSFNLIETGREITGASVFGRFLSYGTASQKLSRKTGAKFIAAQAHDNCWDPDEMQEELARAINTDGLVLYYQPQIDREHIVGAEVLVRWKHPAHGIISPTKFIPLAEETGLILPLGDWVLQSTCAQLEFWARSKVNQDITIAINISAQQAIQPDFAEKITTAVNKFGVNPSNLKLGRVHTNGALRQSVQS